MDTEERTNIADANEQAFASLLEVTETSQVNGEEITLHLPDGDGVLRIRETLAKRNKFYEGKFDENGKIDVTKFSAEEMEAISLFGFELDVICVKACLPEIDEGNIKTFLQFYGDKTTGLTEKARKLCGMDPEVTARIAKEIAPDLTLPER